MIIGNGILELGIVTPSFDGRKGLSIPELESLARATLDICPLGDIFHVAHISIIKVSQKIASSSLFEGIELNKIRLERKNLDIISFISNEMLPRYGYDGIAYSEPHPIVLAHELGHVLGLKHPSLDCTPFCTRKGPENCFYFGHIMACARNSELKKLAKGFSPENLEKLEGWYLR